MKTIKTLIICGISVLLLTSCGCSETSSSYSPASSGYNPSFKASGGHTVALKSRHGGVTYGWGTFYPISKQLVVEGVNFKVVYSSDTSWDYYVPGSDWYFND